ncbi:hypothetical protein [Azovibrio restrictus]|uniref:ApeI family dehydratase n=1 Tax=Azovibrio restrictus TaxID=146938 RepID=UPI0026EA76DC|nr:hypothetical protein [Azovibrio restrictus]MDD3484046.1 hypothetical protein [Azovibrio restrictus]
MTSDKPQAQELIREWIVPTDHPAFPGHFPGRPIVPGVVLLDQALLLAQELSQQEASGWQVGQAKFLSPVGPGETLSFKLVRQPSGQIRFTVSGPGRDVASGSLTPP